MPRKLIASIPRSGDRMASHAGRRGQDDLDEREHSRARSRTTLVLVGGALAAWAVTIDRMRGMDAGPGTDLGGLGWYLGVWVTMTAAMMLPTAAPAARHVARRASAARRRCSSPPGTWRSGRSTASWPTASTGSSSSLDIGQLAWDRSGPYVAGGVIVAAGLYELTPLKRVSLRRCRSAPHGNAVPERSRARPRLRRLLRGADGRALRARRDEPLLDGGRHRRRSSPRRCCRPVRGSHPLFAVALVASESGSPSRRRPCPGSPTRPARPRCRWRWAGEHLARG